MIPKTVHYCWFGAGEMSRLARRCVDSWRRRLPDYELRIWNEANFDVAAVPYTLEAYERRKYAFVADYARLYALREHGGVYMDTDVEAVRGLDGFLNLPAFAGFEPNGIQTGLLASEKGGRWVTELLECYAGRRFIRPDGSSDVTTNVEIISEWMRPHGFVNDGRLQRFEGMVTLFPVDFFCANDPVTQIKNITDNTHTIHHFEGSWVSPSRKFKDRGKRILHRMGIHDAAMRVYKRLL